MTATPEPGAGARVVHFDSVDSTQSVAFSLAAAGAADGTAIVADYQRLGRGRRGHAWSAPRGTSLLMSIVVRPRLDTAETPLLSLATAVAIARAVGRLAPVDARLKWPNDVMVHGRKIAGILLEARTDPTIVAIGIGMNLLQRTWPDDLAARATSIWLETGTVVPRDAALATVLDEFDRWRRCLEQDGFGPVRDAWLGLSDTIGRHVTVDGARGIVVDLAMDGSLVVEDGAARHRVWAGALVEHGGRRVLEPWSGEA